MPTRSARADRRQKPAAPAEGAPTVDQALALLAAWEQADVAADAQNLARWSQVATQVRTAMRQRPPALNAYLIPMA